MSLAEQDNPRGAVPAEAGNPVGHPPVPEGDGEPLSLVQLLAGETSLSQSALEEARSLARESGERFETVLTRLGLISGNELAELLARALGLPLVGPKDFPNAPVLEKVLGRRFLKESRLIPLKEDQSAVTVAMVHPLDAYAVEAMRFATGKTIKRAIAYPADFEAAYARLYRASASDLSIAGRTKTRAHDAPNDNIECLEGRAGEAAVAMRRRYLDIEKVCSITVSWLSAAQMALRQSPKPVRQTVSIGLVAAIHLLGLWLLLASTMAPTAGSAVSEVPMTLSSLPAPTFRDSLPPPELESPALVQIPVPDIEIEPDGQSNTVAAGDTQIIAPRPDPMHPNDLPDSGGAAHAAEAVLRILVLADGTIGDAAVAQSSGTLSLDRLALAYAKANWRYLPATLAGQAIQAWTTVIVRFR